MNGTAAEGWLQVFDGESVCPNLGAAYAVFAQFAIPAGVIRAPAPATLRGRIDGLPPELAQVFAGFVGVVIRRLGYDPDQIDVECWSNRLEYAGDAVDYHVDNDEAVRRSTGLIVPPLVGSIFYLGGGGAVGGTWFRAPIEDPAEDDDLFTMPSFARVVDAGGVGVPFLDGRIVVFDGRSPHCVMPFEKVKLPRAALLCNLWPSRDGYGDTTTRDRS